MPTVQRAESMAVMVVDGAEHSAYAELSAFADRLARAMTALKELL